jgi:hypothetical protein
MGDYRPPDLPSGYNWKWSEEPVAWHGRSAVDRETVFPGRRVLERAGEPWPYSQPELCGMDYGFEWMPPWPELVLICQGCGLDGT